jgi:hypothetical protein
MSENGILMPKDVFEELSQDILKLTIVHANLSEDDRLDYSNILATERAQVLKKMVDTFLATWPTLTITKLTYLSKENELHIKLKNGTSIFLTLQDFTRKTGEALSYKQLTLQYIGLKSFIDSRRSDVEN